VRFTEQEREHPRQCLEWHSIHTIMTESAQRVSCTECWYEHFERNGGLWVCGGCLCALEEYASHWGGVHVITCRSKARTAATGCTSLSCNYARGKGWQVLLGAAVHVVHGLREMMVGICSHRGGTAHCMGVCRKWPTLPVIMMVGIVHRKGESPLQRGTQVVQQSR
jgi:hypothetical protein